MIVIRKGTADRLVEYYGYRPKDTMKAIVLFDGDEIVAVAGIKIMNKNWVMFTDIKEEFRDHPLFKKAVIKSYSELLKMIPDIPVYAAADPDIDGSDRLLKHIGFRNIHENVWVI